MILTACNTAVMLMTFMLAVSTLRLLARMEKLTESLVDLIFRIDGHV